MCIRDSYKAGSEPRIIIQSFFVDLDKMVEGKEDWDHLIDIDPNIIHDNLRSSTMWRVTYTR